jgi:hypothetical protein
MKDMQHLGAFEHQSEQTRYEDSGRLHAVDFEPCCGRTNVNGRVWTP